MLDLRMMLAQALDISNRRSTDSEPATEIENEVRLWKVPCLSCGSAQ